jgi:hypothetical protein
MSELSVLKRKCGWSWRYSMPSSARAARVSARARSISRRRISREWSTACVAATMDA